MVTRLLAVMAVSPFYLYLLNWIFGATFYFLERKKI